MQPPHGLANKKRVDWAVSRGVGRDKWRGPSGEEAVYAHGGEANPLTKAQSIFTILKAVRLLFLFFPYQKALSIN